MSDMMISPKGYENAAVVAYEAGMDMLDRLDLMTITPKTILELGRGLPEISKRLTSRFESSTVIVGYPSVLSAEYARKTTGLPGYICGYPDALALKDHSIDLIIANLIISDYKNIPDLFKEWFRVLAPNGLLMVTSFGLDTLKEYKTYFNESALPYFYDMHDIGDDLVRAGFTDPVLDVSHLTLSYRDPLRLVQELHASGIWLTNNADTFNDVVSEWVPTEKGEYDVTYEVISAHAFAPAVAAQKHQDGTVNIPLSHLKDQLAVRK